MPAPLDPAKRAAIAADIRAGGTGRNAIAKKHGVSGSVVGKIAAAEGIDGPWDRSQTKAATVAAQVDAVSERVAQAQRWREFSSTVLGSLERMTPEEWATISPFDRARIAGIAVDKALVLSRDDGAAERDAGALIAGLVDGLRGPRAEEPAA